MKTNYIKPDSFEIWLETQARILNVSFNSTDIEDLTLEDDSDEWN